MSLKTATGRAASKPDLTFVILIHQSDSSGRGAISAAQEWPQPCVLYRLPSPQWS